MEKGGGEKARESIEFIEFRALSPWHDKWKSAGQPGPAHCSTAPGMPHELQLLLPADAGGAADAVGGAAAGGGAGGGGMGE